MSTTKCDHQLRIDKRSIGFRFMGAVHAARKRGAHATPGGNKETIFRAFRWETGDRPFDGSLGGSQRAARRACGSLRLQQEKPFFPQAFMK